MRENTKSINQRPLYDNAGERRLEAGASPRRGLWESWARSHDGPYTILSCGKREFSQRQFHHNQAGVHEEQNFEKILRIRKKQSKKKNTLDLTPFSDVNAPRAQNRRLSKKERLEEISGGHVKVCRGKWTSCTKLLPSSARKTVCGFQAEARDRSYEFVANSRTEIWSVPFLSLFLTFFFSTLISDPTH